MGNIIGRKCDQCKWFAREPVAYDVTDGSSIKIVHDYCHCPDNHLHGILVYSGYEAEFCSRYEEKNEEDKKKRS